MSIIRTQHGLDVLVSGRNRRKTISNWMHTHVLDSSDANKHLGWVRSNIDTNQATGTPDHWQGNFDFQYKMLNAPLQVFLGDSTDPSNRALVGMRRADNPSAWMNFKFIGIDNSVDMEVFPAQKAVRWQNLWNNATLWFHLNRHKLEKKIRLSAPGHPSSFRFAVRIPQGYTLELVSDTLVLRDSEGDIQIKTRAPWGKDSSTVSLDTIEGNQLIRVSLVEADSIMVGQNTFRTFKLIPNADDLATAVYPVVIDPDVVISGTTDIEDNRINAGSPNVNYGSGTTLVVGAFNKTILRIIQSALPEGSVSLFEFNFHQDPNSFSTVTRVIRTYRIKTAQTWTELGSTNWWSTGSTNWLGGDGLGSPGGSSLESTAVGSFTNLAHTSAPARDYTMTLEPQWVEDWQTGVHSDYGFQLRIDSDHLLNSLRNLRSTEDGSFPPTFDITYEGAETTSKSFFLGIGF